MCVQLLVALSQLPRAVQAYKINSLFLKQFIEQIWSGGERGSN